MFLNIRLVCPYKGSEICEESNESLPCSILDLTYFVRSQLGQLVQEVYGAWHIMILID
jgi:hypothetical protein